MFRLNCLCGIIHRSIYLSIAKRKNMVASMSINEAQVALKFRRIEAEQHA